MNSYDRKLADLVNSVQHSVGNPDHWQTVLQQIAVELEATKASMHVHSFARQKWEVHKAGSRLHSLGYDSTAAIAYANDFAVHDPYVQRIRERFRGQAAGTSDDLLTAEELKGSRFYADYGRPNGIFFVSWAVVEQNEEYGSGLAFIRPEDAMQFTRRQVELLNFLIAPVGSAFRTQRLIDDLNSRNQALTSGLAQFGISVVALDGKGYIADASPSALALLDKREGIAVQAGRLRAIDAGEDHQFQVTLRRASQALDRPHQPQCPPLLLSRPKDKAPLQVTASCIGSSSAARALLGADRPWVLVSLTDPSSKPPSREASLRSLYKLSRPESRLAGLFLEGLPPKIAADQMKITLSTAQFYLKRVLEKTGTHRQAALMKFMLEMPGELAIDGTAPKKKPASIIEMNPGRTLKTGKL